MPFLSYRVCLYLLLFLWLSHWLLCPSLGNFLACQNKARKFKLLCLISCIIGKLFELFFSHSVKLMGRDRILPMFWHLNRWLQEGSLFSLLELELWCLFQCSRLWLVCLLLWVFCLGLEFFGFWQMLFIMVNRKDKDWKFHRLYHALTLKEPFSSLESFYLSAGIHKHHSLYVIQSGFYAT